MKSIAKYAPTVIAGVTAFFTGDIVTGVLVGLAALLLFHVPQWLLIWI
tara:strand:- start:468 stop:611 length:144 start_codon:yes stop_codon:yes gene_type:complete